MSLVDDTEVRTDVPIDPRTHVVGRAAAARYITATMGLPLDATDLAAFADIGAGPPGERMVNGQHVYAKRKLDYWTIVEYGDHDGTSTGIATMLWMYFQAQGGPGLYVPTYCPATGKVDLVWIEEVPLTAEQVAAIAAERDAADPILPE